MPTEISGAADFTATIIFTIVSGVVVIEVTVIVVITTRNKHSELPMKRPCVDALPRAARCLRFKHAPLWSVCERVDREDDSTFRPSDNFPRFPYDCANRALAVSVTGAP